MSKILIISLQFPPEIGGAGVVSWQAAKSLADLGHEVTVVTKLENVEALGSKLEKFSLIGVKTHKIIRPYELWFQLKARLAAFDLIILGDAAASVFGALCLPQRVLDRTAVYLHGQEVPEILERPSLKARLAKYPRKYLNLLENCKSIIAVSQSMKSDILSAVPNRFIKNKTEVIYNGYDSAVFCEQSSDARDKLDIPIDAQVLVSASRIVKRKGYSAMLDVFTKLIDEGGNYYWIVIGDGNYLDDMKRRVTGSSLEPFVRFIGAVTQKEMPYYYCAANVFWLLTEYKESLGNVYFEANACGLPTIGPRQGGVVESIQENVTGYLVDSTEECYKILHDKRYKNLRSSLFLKHLEKFNAYESWKNSKIIKLID